MISPTSAISAGAGVAVLVVAGLIALRFVGKILRFAIRIGLIVALVALGLYLASHGGFASVAHLVHGALHGKLG